VRRFLFHQSDRARIRGDGRVFGDRAWAPGHDGGGVGVIGERVEITFGEWSLFDIIDGGRSRDFLYDVQSVAGRAFSRLPLQAARVRGITGQKMELAKTNNGRWQSGRVWEYQRGEVRFDWQTEGLACEIVLQTSKM